MSKYDTVNLGSGGEFPNGENVLHININQLDLPKFPKGGSLVADATKLVMIPDNHFIVLQGNHIPGDLNLATGMISEGFRILKSGGKGTFSSSSLSNIKELMDKAGFTNIKNNGVAPRTIYQGRVTQPAIEYTGIKP